ncbi:hypothetical protein NW757_002469 [Fusarium falciforme]|nr:hypothetical protein NW757_002469 [Fusarium falciforme]
MTLNRPWLYRSRWLIVGFVVAFDANMIRTMSSMNVACAYASGLMGIWGILSTLNLLVWTDPQSNYARAVKLVKDSTKMNGASKHHVKETNGSSKEDGLRQRKTGSIPEAKDGEEPSRLEDSGCVWQTFPENGSFGERLNWTFDLATNFRKIGKTSPISDANALIT